MKYYSETLKRVFESVEELEAAEKELLKQEEEKRIKAEEKKAEAVKVENAFKTLNEAKSDYNKAAAEAKKRYFEAVAEARKIYEEEVDIAYELVVEGEATYQKALDEFLKKHPEGFHTTYKDGNSTISVRYEKPNLSKLFDTLLDLF